MEISGVNSAAMSNQLIIKHAGSLGVAFGEINNEFKRLHPEVNVLSGGGGSASLVRDVINGKKCGVLASADYKLITELLFPNHASWYIIFAASRIVLRYTDQAKYHNEINEKNWIEILQRPGVTIWHSDPNEDPGGYRTLMVLQLAERYFHIPGLYSKLMTPEHDRIISRSNFQESASGYSFGYGLRIGSGNSKIISIPDEINLSRQDFTEYYSNAVVNIPGKNPGESISLRGEPILFGITVPEICSHKEIALEWVRLLLSASGSALLDKAGLVPLIPAIASNIKMIPQSLKSRVQ
jgi:molybdate/tungstate transport system substrate-binding protein